MKRLNQFFAFAVVMSTLFLTSCSMMDTASPAFDSILWEEELGLQVADDEVTVDELDAEYYELTDGLRSPKCLDLVFPVNVIFPDGTVVTFDSGEAIKEGIKAYYEANGKGGGRPQLEFPVEVELPNGDVVTVESKEEMKGLAKECARKRKRIAIKRCLSLVYPVTINFPDGSQTEVFDGDELKETLEDWRDNNPGATERPKIDLPFEVETANGNTFTITEKADLKEALADCRG